MVLRPQYGVDGLNHLMNRHQSPKLVLLAIGRLRECATDAISSIVLGIELQRGL